MNIFSILPTYAAKWNVTNSRSFSSEEKSGVESAKVVDSQYGLSVCFLMKNGGQKFIPLSTNSTLQEGSEVNLDNAKLLTLSREGDDDIFRIEA